MATARELATLGRTEVRWFEAAARLGGLAASFLADVRFTCDRGGHVVSSHWSARQSASTSMGASVGAVIGCNGHEPAGPAGYSADASFRRRQIGPADLRTSAASSNGESALGALLSAAVSALYIVEGLGGSRRSRDGAASRVVEAAAAAGWTPSIVGLGDMAQRVDDPGVDVVRVVLCGGDGLIHRALPYLVHTDVEVAVVPVGSGNDFARAFGISAEGSIRLATAPADAVAVTTGVDVIAVDDSRDGSTAFVASVLTGGYSGRVTATANRMRFPRGSAKYTVAALVEIGRLDPIEARLVLSNDAGDEQQVIEGPLTMFAIGNTGYFGGGMHICPSADATDGLLDVVGLGRVGRVEFARWLPRVFKGQHLDHSAVTTGRATSIRVESTEPLWGDGEALQPTGDRPHHKVTVRSAALRLLRPVTKP